MNKKNKKLLTILFIIALILFIAYGFFRRNSLRKDHQLWKAAVTGCSSGGRGNAGRVFLEYTLIVDGIHYKRSTVFLTSELSFSDCSDNFIGKIFPVTYNPKNPSNSQLLIEPKQFAQFGYAFPDSLRWVVKYFKEKN